MKSLIKIVSNRLRANKFTRQSLVVFLISSILSIAGCAGHVTAYNTASDVTVSTITEQKLWHQAAEFEKALKNFDQVVEDPELIHYTQTVMNKLFPEYDGKIKVRVLDNHNLNAFALPNGSVYVHTGLLSALENEAQLATVLAHEGMHFVYKHGEKSYNTFHNSAGFSVFIAAMGIPLLGDFAALSVISGYSKGFETQADESGFQRLKQAGYDLRESPKAFQKLAEEAKARNIKSYALFASHPKLSSRIANFDRLIAQAAKEGDRQSNYRGEAPYNGIVMPLREKVLNSKLEGGQYNVLIDVIGQLEDKSLYPASVYYFIAEAYRMRGRSEDSTQITEAFEIAMTQVPDYPPLYRALGEHHLKLGNQDKAKKHFQQYLSLSPNATDKSFIEFYLQDL